MGGEKKTGKNPIIYLSKGRWILQCVLIRNECFVLVEVSLLSAEDTSCFQEVLWVTCSLVCLPGRLPIRFSWLCWRPQLWMAGEVSWLGDVELWSRGCAPPGWHTIPQQRYGGVDGNCPPLLGASACPSSVWPAAFASAAALVLPSRAWLLAGQCWPPAVPPATRWATCSSTVLAALAPPQACCVVLRLLGKLEEMPKQQTLLCLSKEPSVMSENLSSHLPQWTSLATACVFPGQSNVTDPPLPLGLCLTLMDKADSWRCTEELAVVLAALSGWAEHFGLWFWSSNTGNPLVQRCYAAQLPSAFCNHCKAVPCIKSQRKQTDTWLSQTGERLVCTHYTGGCFEIRSSIWKYDLS